MHKNPVTLLYIAGALLALMGAAHGFGHMLAIAEVGNFSFGRRALYETMRAYELEGPFGANRWTAFTLFSLGHAFGLVFAGLATIQIANMGSAALRRRFAAFSALFWGAAGAIWMWLSPAAGALLVAVPAVLLYGLSWHRSR
jgi:hypothetical protein